MRTPAAQRRIPATRKHHKRRRSKPKKRGCKVVRLTRRRLASITRLNHSQSWKEPMEEIKKGKKKQKKQRKIEGKKKLKQALPHSE